MVNACFTFSQEFLHFLTASYTYLCVLYTTIALKCAAFEQRWKLSSGPATWMRLNIKLIITYFMTSEISLPDFTEFVSIIIAKHQVWCLFTALPTYQTAFLHSHNGQKTQL